MTEAPEIWKPVVGFEGRYEVSDLGRVRSLLSGRVLKTSLDLNGYPIITFKKPKTTIRVHQLVLRAFLGPAEGRVVRHRKAPKSNVVLSNLEYGTQKDNAADRRRDGTELFGSAKPFARLSEDRISAIREDPRVQREIAAEYGVHQAVISRIKTGKAWRHV